MSDYLQEGDMLICDGTQWSLFVRYEDSRVLMYGGDNTYPESWDALITLFVMPFRFAWIVALNECFYQAHLS